MRRVLVPLAALALFLPAAAKAELVTRDDGFGRRITFDVTAGTNVETLARTLRHALHGREIEGVTIRLVSRSALARFCGRRMASCYRSGWRDGTVILLPAHGGRSTRFMLLHEYAHHLDATYELSDAWRRAPAAERWWVARRIDQRLRSGQVTWDYELGWQRSIGEIFAEDYVQLHARTRYGIRWLRPPSLSVRLALRDDVSAAVGGPFSGAVVARRIGDRPAAPAAPGASGSSS